MPNLEYILGRNSLKLGEVERKSGDWGKIARNKLKSGDITSKLVDREK